MTRTGDKTQLVALNGLFGTMEEKEKEKEKGVEIEISFLNKYFQI